MRRYIALYKKNECTDEVKMVFAFSVRPTINIRKIIVSYIPIFFLSLSLLALSSYTLHVQELQLFLVPSFLEAFFSLFLSCHQSDSKHVIVGFCYAILF